MYFKQIKKIIENYVDSLNSLDISKIISLVHQEINIYSMKNGKIIKLAFWIEEFKSILNSFDLDYQFIYWKILNKNIKNEVAEITIKQKIFFMEDIPDGPKAWDMKEQISKMIFKFEKLKIKNIFIIHKN